MPATYPILIHSGFYKILRESSAAFRARVQKTMLRLREGQWGGGTRVKRLAGVGHAIFEARVGAGDRLLFTAGSPARLGDPEELNNPPPGWGFGSHHYSHPRPPPHFVSGTADPRFFPPAEVE